MVDPRQRCEKCGHDELLMFPLDKDPPREEWRRWAIHYSMLLLRDAYDGGDPRQMHDWARAVCVTLNDAIREEL